MLHVVVSSLLFLLAGAAAVADEGPWSQPRWYVETTEAHGPFTHTTGMSVSQNAKAGRDDVEVMCQVTDVRAPRDAIVVRRRGKALFRQDAWCGDAGDLGSWCVALEEGAVMTWYGKTICAGGQATFSTGD
ncbi:hypothetical protein FV232_17140 [Methylobacterium sp. WL30]|uniref:hypothetical protein n=1 Tax=unclassified Methylobacterium TaxID=2615210 RepID=UPI0011C7EBE7|nr:MULTISPECIES: hypothetical protein [unclassified Methylobacterium]TXN41706.1 hypothetical protein FV225_01560 [Methylobacterium sp. WL93]TXN51056.1 hypothetical protein FV227_09590 [Methylobacterium sp. WL119]TXN65816.1 hypothetical protein FV232_17140 [Methylobacterium sp. WL30]TXN75117.1 hypothetical protein FV228_04465 [Methylobacterium sp. WL18]